MYTFKTHTRRTDALSLRGDVDENLDWNERPLYPHHCHKGGIGPPRHDFDAWFWDENGEKQKPVSFDGV